MFHSCLALFLLLPAGLGAQQLSGRIEGVVTDPQSALVAGASILATHQQTNTPYRATTGSDGGFVLPNVRLGVYTVAAEAAGFRRAVIQDVAVEVGGTAHVKFALEVGRLQEEVTVTAEAAQSIVNTADAELGAVVDNRRVLELPLNGRNAAELALQQAGVYFERSPDGQGDKLIVHGQRHRALQLTLDGIDTQDNYNRASSIMIDQPLLAMASENVEEFRVVTGLSSAEYSRGGAQISAVTRAGSNQLRGSLFWFNRNSFFGANEFFNNSAIPRVETPPLNRNQFGGRVGGPIFRDRTFFYLGYQQTRESRGTSVNRTVYKEEARQGIFRYLDGLRNTAENVAANPDRIRSVNLLACGGTLPAVLGRECVDSRFSLARRPTLDPFINNEIFRGIPLPNNTDLGDGLNTGGFRFNAKSLTVEHLPAIRIDHRLGSRHNLYATFNYIDRNIQGDYINSREPVYPAFGPLGDRLTLSRGLSLALTSTLSPAIVNEARLGFLGGENAFDIRQPFPTPFTLDLNTISDPYTPGGGDSSRDNRTVHLRNVLSWVRGSHQVKAGVEARQRFVDLYSFSNINAAGQIGLDDDDNPPGFSGADLTRLAGARSINASDEETARDLINNLAGTVGEIFQSYQVRSLESGFVANHPFRRTYKNHELDWFVSDTWRMRPNLTLNLGLRWEYASIPYETRGLALAPRGGLASVFGVSGVGGFFNPGVFEGERCNSLQSLPRAATTANAVGLITDCATRYFPATSKNGANLWKDDHNNFGPVVSLAWDPFGNGKTSVRAGFRISYVQDAFAIIDGNLDDNEGLEVTQSCIAVDGSCQNNPAFLRDVSASGPPLPRVPPFALPSTRSILDNATIDFRAFDQNLSTPYYNEWTFGISREIAAGWALEARYVGNRGGGLRRVADYNEINVGSRDRVTGQTFLDAFVSAQRNLSCNRGAGLGARFDDATGAGCISPNPLMAALLAGDPTRLRNRTGLVNALDFNETAQFAHRLTQVETSSPAAGQGVIRGGSFWGQVLAGRFPANFFMANPFVASARAMINDGSSTYHALEVELRRRFAQGFTMQANYSYGKALGDFDGDDNTLINDVRPSSVRNPRYSRQEFMPRQQFNANWVYELPLGPGKPWLQGGGVTGKITGGWQLSGLLNWRSGRPLSILSGVGTFHRTGVSAENTVNLTEDVTADRIRDLSGKRSIGPGVFWLDPCMSSFLGGACTDPNAPRGLFALPQPGSLGQLGQSILFGPSRFTVDMSLMKRARLRESRDLEFRWEVFNVLNKANFNVPTVNITSSNFGQITRTVSAPRLMQFALKINF